MDLLADKKIALADGHLLKDADGKLSKGDGEGEAAFKLLKKGKAAAVPPAGDPQPKPEEPTNPPPAPTNEDG